MGPTRTHALLQRALKLFTKENIAVYAKSTICQGEGGMSYARES